MKGEWDWETVARRPTQEDNMSDDENMEGWFRKMLTVLTDEGVGYVVRFGLPPDPLKIPVLAAMIQPKELCKWRELAREDMKALQIMQSTLPDSFYRRSIWAPSSKSLWDYLNAVTVHVAEECVGGFSFEDNIWTISFKTTNHMTPYDKFLTDLATVRRAEVRLTSEYNVVTILTGQGVGDVTFMTKEGEKMIKNVLYVPGTNVNVLSVSQLERSGFKVVMDRERCTIWDRTTGKIFGDTMWEKRGFCMRFDVIKRR